MFSKKKEIQTLHKVDLPFLDKNSFPCHLTQQLDTWRTANQMNKLPTLPVELW